VSKGGISPRQVAVVEAGWKEREGIGDCGIAVGLLVGKGRLCGWFRPY